MKRSRIEDLRFANWPLATAVVAWIAGAVIVGDSVTVSHSRAIVLAYLAVALAAVARLGLLGLTLLLTGTLPWLVVVGGVLPRLTETFAAGTTLVLTILLVAPRRDASSEAFLLRLGIVCFFAPVLISLQRQGYGDQFIQAAKYTVFPAIVLAVTEGTNYRSLRSLRTVALWSSAGALIFALCIGLAGYDLTTKDRSSYATGVALGFGHEHGLALLAGCFTAATIATAASWKWAPATAIGAIATIATGVRSALPGLAALVLVKMVSAGARIRTILLVGVAVAAVFASGAANVLEARFRAGEQSGEFKSFSAFGSGRGSIYTVAIDRWRASSPIDWVVGTGLRSIPRFEQEALGSPLVGHSDIIEVGVQLGIVGLIGFILIWWILIARAESKAPLLILGSFSLFNGALEYAAPLLIAVLLTTGLRDTRGQRPAAASPGAGPPAGPPSRALGVRRTRP